MDVATTSGLVSCPVCTLYLRPGITLDKHLQTHPKSRVIEALVSATTSKERPPSQLPPWQQYQRELLTGVPPPPQTQTILVPIQTNSQSIIYQQFVSSTANQLFPINQIQPQFVQVSSYNGFIQPAVYQQPVIGYNNTVSVQVQPPKPQPPPPPKSQPTQPPPKSQPTPPPPPKTQPTPHVPSPKPVAVPPDEDNQDKSVSTLQLTDISKLLQLRNLKNSEEFGQMQIIPIFKKPTQEDEDDEDSPIQSLEPEISIKLTKRVEETPAAEVTERAQVESPVEETPVPEVSLYQIPKSEVQIIQNEVVQNVSHSDKPTSSLEVIKSYIESDEEYEMEPSVVVTSVEYDRSLQCTENIRERTPPILLDISELKIQERKFNLSAKEDYRDETMGQDLSGDGLNIRADECMPPKGELSEQESNGGIEETWGKLFVQEGSSGVSTSYDLIARESWEASDSSDSELIPALQSRIPPPVTYSESLSSTKSQTRYNCNSCHETFFCPKERRVHQANIHGDISEPISQSKMENGMLEVSKMGNGFPESLLEVKTEELMIEDMKPEEDDKDIKVTFCELCKEQFKSNKEYVKHHRVRHKGVPIPRYKCDQCSETFSVEYTFTAHLKVHPLKCLMCSKNFYRRQNLKLHLKRHLGIKKYKCKVCPKVFVNTEKKKEHENIHKGLTPYKCTQCDDKFRRYSNLVQHRDLKHPAVVKKKTRDYVCQCGEVYKSKKRFNWHQEIHDGKPKACTYCSEKFIHVSSLTRHIRKAHNTYFLNDPSVNNVECGICKKIYLKTSLDAHMKLHSGVKPFSCNICNREFSTKWNLKLHRWVHASRTSKPFKCTLCQAAFIRGSDYISHLHSHKNIKPYTCNHCGRQFIRKSNCQRHVKEHEMNKSFKCSLCNKEFHRSYYLQEHLRVHSGARPFTCHICGKSSTTKSNHNKHVKIHHAREPVSTEN